MTGIEVSIGLTGVHVVFVVINLTKIGLVTGIYDVRRYVVEMLLVLFKGARQVFWGLVMKALKTIL